MVYTALLIMAFFIPYEIDFRHHSIGLPVINTSLEILAVALVFIWLVKKFRDRDFRIKSTPFDLPILLFLAWNVISCFTSVNPLWSLKFTFKLSGGIVLYYIAVETIKSRKQLRTLVLFLLASSVIVSVLGLGERIIPDTVKNIIDIFCRGQFRLPEGETIRAKSTFFYPNSLAAYLEVIIFIAGGLLLTGKLFDSKRNLIILLLAAETMMLTYSRGGLVGVYGALLALIWICYRKEYLKFKIKNLLFMGAIITGLFLITTVFDSVLAGRLASMFDLNSNANIERVHLYKSAIKITMDHPLKGVGPDGFMWVYNEKYAQEAKFSSVTWTGGIPSGNSHNMFLEMSSNLGIPGVLIFLWLFVSIIRYQLKILAKPGNGYPVNIFIGLSAGIWTFFIHGLVDYFWQFQSIILFFWLIMGAMVSAGKLGEE